MSSSLFLKFKNIVSLKLLLEYKNTEKIQILTVKKNTVKKLPLNGSLKFYNLKKKFSNW